MLGPGLQAPATVTNLVANYYRAGSKEGIGSRLAPISLDDNGSQTANAGVYMEGNKTDTAAGITDTQFEIQGAWPAPKTSPFNYPPVATTFAAQAYTDVLANAGATLPCRDSVDKGVVSNIQNRGGSVLVRGAPLTWPDLSASCGNTQQLVAPSNLQVFPQ